MTTTDTMPADPFAQPSQGRIDPEDDLIRNGRYWIPKPEDPSKKGYYTRVTTWAKHISDTYRLSLWQQRMAVAGICMDDGLRAEASTMDVTADRKEFDALVEAAKRRADTKSRDRVGTALHRFTEKIDAGEITLETVPATWRPDVAAYFQATTDLGLEPYTHEGRLMSEVTVYEPVYEIVGTLDRIMRVTRPLVIKMMDGRRIALEPGDLLIFDLKTGAKALEYGGQEISIQLSCYANATLIFDKKTRTYSPMPEGVRTDVALALHLPAGEHRAVVAGLDIAAGWEACWLIRQVKNWQNRKDLAAPVLTVEVND